MKLGILGIGRMGSAIAERLLDCGHTLTVWNRSPQKAAKLIERGATLAVSPIDVVENSEIVISILTDAKAIEDCYCDLLKKPLNGKTFIEMSTVRPITEQYLAKQIRAQGGAIVECPVGGTVTPAREGKLFGLVGGIAQDVDRVRPILEQMCRRVEHVGEVGSGASLKLAINLPLLVYWQAIGEALALAQPIGLDPARLLDILSDTSGAPSILKLRAPAIASSLKGIKGGGAHFNLDSIRKDLRTMIEEGEALGYQLPLASSTLTVFDQASAGGLGEGDGTEVAAWWLKASCKK